MGYLNKILSKSNSYNFYKENYENLTKTLKQLKKENDELQKELNDLEVQYNDLNSKYLKLLDKCELDFPFFNTDGLLLKFYISPVIKFPFTFEHKWFFSFSEHLAKYVRETFNKNEFISIILPIRNYENNIINLINSILNQSYSNFELIIVDDCSDDNTLKVLESFSNPKIKIFSNDEEKGFSFCRNLALDNAKGEYIFYIDMNNRWDQEYLSTMLSVFNLLPDADAIYSGQIIYNNDFKNISGTIFGAYNKSLLYNNNFISLSAFAHKKDLCSKIHFDESLNYFEDWNFILNISKNFKMYSAPFFLSKYSSNKYFHEKLGFNYDLDKENIDKIHENIGYNIIKDFSRIYELRKKVSIIIPSYNVVEDLKDCINTILSFDSNFIDIIVVDNNSTEEVREYLNQLYLNNKIKYIQNDVNYGFTYAVEQGINVSDENSDILLLNNDATLTKGSLEAMQYYAYKLHDCGIVVPRETLYSEDIRMAWNVPYANIAFECDVSTSKIHKNILKIPVFFDGDVLELDFAPFFCTYIKRDVYNDTLGLDSELGRHYNSDRIFCDFVRNFLNLKIYHISETKVYHKSQQSTKKLEDNKKDYDIIFVKNQWEPELAKKLGYKNYSWNI